MQLYEEVEPQDACEAPIVIEFFAYQCPHCNTLEDYLKKWEKPEGVIFKLVPTDLGRKEFFPFILVHVAAEKLGIIDTVKTALFNRIHKEQKMIQSQEDAIQILVEAGAKKEAAEAVLKDEEYLKTSIESNYELLRKYKITGVPDLLVNYQYKTSPRTAKGYDNVFPTINNLLKNPLKCKK
nr:DsbA family protein [Pleionea sp. CnH1-48]